jgi:aminoacrylate hydrolase
VAGFPPKDVMLARIQALLDFDVDDRLGEILHPVLVSASADDMLVPVACSMRLAERLPNAVLEVAPWGGHGFTVTDPETFNAALLQFLEGREIDLPRSSPGEVAQRAGGGPQLNRPERTPSVTP